MRINVLPPYVFNRISAGEVVEKPASIVKELVENSIDAGATIITIEIEDGGKKRIAITDNGSGIEKEDLKTAFLPHATSKLKDVDDLDKIETLGFRGEALASISSVCHTFLSTKTANADAGSCIEVNGGVIGEVKDIARGVGTTLECRDLFFNTPARAKFLRKSKLEEGEITHVVQKFMLANPTISFLYIVDGKQIYNTTSSGLYDIIYTIYGKEIYDNIIEVDYKEDDLTLQGVVIAPKVSKSNRTFQTLFVNNRYVENYLISSAIQGVYECFLMKGKFPIYVLNLIVAPESIDVNVHPTKKEVKFENSNKIFGFVRRAIEDALTKANHIGSFFVEPENYDEKDENESKDSFNKAGFNHVPLMDLDKIDSGEGVSYKSHKNTFEDDELPPLKEVNITNDNEKVVQEEKEEELDMFKNFRKEFVVPETKKGGPFYFDQKVHNSSIFSSSDSAEDVLRQSRLEEIKVLGAIFNTYVVAELEESVFIIDQHAAHERTLFDRLKKEIDAKIVSKQDLLIPFEFEVNALEIEIVDKNLDTLKELGFDIKHEKEGKYIITALPLVLSNISLKNFVENMLAEGAYLSNQPSDILKDKLVQSACKHAVKGGDALSKEQILYIIEAMRKGVLLCPHGRPTVLELTKKDIEKMFKRIV